MKWGDYLSRITQPTTLIKHIPHVSDLTLSKMFGIELELFLVDRDGKICNDADKVISRLKNKLLDTEIKQECGKSMVEISSFPHISTAEVFGKFLTDYETMLYDIEKNELGLYHYGCYPGKNTTIVRESQRYSAKSSVFGIKEFTNESKCAGFHCHYTLPKNSFNELMNFFYFDIKNTSKNRILNLFNLYIALDPALTTFMQSSPYFESELYGKDSRIMAYRGDSSFKIPHAVYSRYPEFGTLNEYAHDFKTLIDRIVRRNEKLKILLKQNNYSFSDFIKKEHSILDSTWKPVKISQHGTIECRGADMNSLSMVISASTIMKHISKYIENNSINVIPSDIGNDEPFKLEDKTLHIPEHKSVLKIQNKAAIYGILDEEVYNYCKSMLKLSKSIVSDGRKTFIEPFRRVIDERQTTSDIIIKYVKKKQGYSNYRIITDETAQELTILFSERIFKDLFMARKISDD